MSEELIVTADKIQSVYQDVDDLVCCQMLAMAMTNYAKRLEAERNALRVELDKADGARQELMAENERLRNRCAELVAQCNANYDPLRKQIEEQGIAQAGYEYATQIVIDDLRAKLEKANNRLRSLIKIADEYYAFGLSGFDGEYTQAIAYLKSVDDSR
jgi:DUF971 family protein